MRMKEQKNWSRKKNNQVKPIAWAIHAEIDFPACQMKSDVGLIWVKIPASIFIDYIICSKQGKPSQSRWKSGAAAPVGAMVLITCVQYLYAE